MSRKKIPDEVRRKILDIVARYNSDMLGDSEVRYVPHVRGAFLYLDRSDFGRVHPICRLKYSGDITNWTFAIYKYSSNNYSESEWLFPGGGLVDGTVEGAMSAGIEAYQP